MYTTLQDFKKKKEYLVAIDSDGCVFDTMTLKHQQFFYPLLEQELHLEQWHDELSKQWDTINLYGATRGINRFLGVYHLFKDKKVKDLPFVKSMDLYNNYIQKNKEITLEALIVLFEETKDTFVHHIIEWSKAVNKAIDQTMPTMEPFEESVETIKELSEIADIAIVSSANEKALKKEWGESGLHNFVSVLTSQNDGSKKEILTTLVNKGYSKNNVLMIGDAEGDRQAAFLNQVDFRLVKACKENQSWIDIREDYRIVQKLRSTKDKIYKQVKLNLDYFITGVAHVSEDGIYPLVENKLWTASFYPGMTYLAYTDTEDKAFLKNRSIYLELFKERCLQGHMMTHDIGFLFDLTYVKDYELFQEPEVLGIAIVAADKLMARYHKEGGFIQAWGAIDVSEEQTRIIIDTMMNVEFLFRMSELTGNQEYREAAINHCLVSSKTLIRKDGSSYHTYYLKKNGEFIGGKTHQGHEDESTWARGQAWAVYGFSRSYLFTKDKRFLETAISTANVYIEHLPSDFVHFWDFDFNEENPDIRDSSAASIGAMGLLLLNQALKEAGEENKIQISHSSIKEENVTSRTIKDYKEIAIKIVESLIDHYMNTQLKLGQGILREGMYHRDQGFNECTSWGDYYFLEAIQELLKY